MSPRLSARQTQCLRLTAHRTDREIAAHLGLSEATVKKHVHEACQRLGVNRRKAALALLDAMDVAPEGVAEGMNSTPPIDDGNTAALPPAAVHGYQPPPRSPLIRMALIVGLAVVLVAVLTSVTAMVSNYHTLMDRFDPQERQTQVADTADAATIPR